MVCIARWESRGRKHWAALYRYSGQNGLPDWFGYRSRNGGGCLGSVITNVPEERAVTTMQERVDSGWFLSDAAVLPMERIV
jgi:hypothetical protein